MKLIPSQVVASKISFNNSFYIGMTQFVKWEAQKGTINPNPTEHKRMLQLIEEHNLPLETTLQDCLFIHENRTEASIDKGLELLKEKGILIRQIGDTREEVELCSL